MVSCIILIIINYIYNYSKFHQLQSSNFKNFLRAVVSERGPPKGNQGARLQRPHSDLFFDIGKALKVVHLLRHLKFFITLLRIFTITFWLSRPISRKRLLSFDPNFGIGVRATPKIFCGEFGSSLIFEKQPPKFIFQNLSN